MNMAPTYKLLFVENDIQTRTNTLNYLKSLYNFEYITASNGQEAWNYYLKYKPEVIITNIKMDYINGLDLIEKIREVDKETKIIIASGDSNKETLFRAIRLNLVDFLVKPINRKDIRDSINYVLELLKDEKKTKKVYFTQIDYYDKDSKTLFLNGETIKLSKKEFSLLDMLSDNCNNITQTPDILSQIWEDNTASEQSVRTLVKKLRKKLPQSAIENVYGGGYKLNIAC